MPFKPGQSGNPNGRPKKPSVFDILGTRKIENLVRIAYEKAEKGDKDMVKYLLDQGLGKAPQKIVGPDDGDGYNPLIVKIIGRENGNKNNTNGDTG